MGIEPPLDIRVLEPDDAPSYKRLREMAAEDPAFGTSPATEAAYSVELVRQTLAPTGQGYVLGVFRNDLLVGMVGFGEGVEGVRGRSGTLYGLFVDPSHRRHGIARMLVTRLISLVSADRISLRVAPDNKAAMRLYQDVGFRVQAETRDEKLLVLEVS